MSRFFVLVALLAVGSLILATLAARAEPREDGPPSVGGPSTYVRYAGTATIVRVEKTEASNANKGEAAEGYEVWFTFMPKKAVKEELGKGYLARFKEHQFTLCNGWCPGPKFLKKYGIEKGKAFACTLMVETQGTATPVILEFDDVPNTDYFEAAPGT